MLLTPNITVDTTERHQEIDGFGAALPMWTSSASGMLTTDEVHKFVGLGAGELGLSLLRTMIDPDMNRWSYAVANLQEAKSYGSSVRVLATPWSPPADMKDNDSTVGGGKLLLDHYDDYANHLNDYVAYMASQGVTIDVVSVQNEPDWHPEYESCDWNGTELRNFVRDHGATIQGARLMVAESLQFTRSYTDPTLNDAAAASNVDFIGGHLYGAEEAGKFTEYPLAAQRDKPVWMTEWLTHEADGDGAAICGGENQAVWDETLDEVLRSVDRAMRIDWSAYIWWWGRRFYSLVGDGDAAFGTTKGQVLKRGYAFSHFSRFVRPGHVRAGTEVDSAHSALDVTAYEASRRIVVVILNRSGNGYTDVVIEIPSDVASAEAYVTSRTANRSPTPVERAGRYATLDDLPARSITTLVLSSD